MSDQEQKWSYEQRRHFELETFGHGWLCEARWYVQQGTTADINNLRGDPAVLQCLNKHQEDESAKIVVLFPDPTNGVPFKLDMPVDSSDFVNDSLRAAVQATEYFKAQCVDVDLVTATAQYRLLSATEAHHVTVPPKAAAPE